MNYLRTGLINIISNDHNNRYTSIVTVLPVTDKGYKYIPFDSFSIFLRIHACHKLQIDFMN